MENDIINATAFEYSKTVSPQLSTLCDPFLSTVGLTTFLYGRVFYDGKYIMLSNNVDWIKSWLWEISTLEDTILHSVLQNAPLGEPFYFLWATAPCNKLIKMHNELGIFHGFDISYRLEDSIEGWSFSTTQDHELLNQFYFNNLKLLHRFVLFLREKSSELFEIKDNTQLAVFKKSVDLSFHSSFNSESMNSLFSSLPLNGYSFQIQGRSVRLSRREIECTLHFSQGKTSKEIGRLLNLSPRTVEAYVKDIRLKTDHVSKSVLADMLKNDLLKWL